MHRIFRHALPLAMLASGLTTLGVAASCDILIRGARIVDGTGAPWRYADVAISGDRIVAVGKLADFTAVQVVDADGKFLAPGFIDGHSHAGPALARSAELAAAAPILAQGITTVFVNHDGGGPVDLPVQRRSIEGNGLGVNVAQLIGHNSVRTEVLGLVDRAPTKDELAQMQALVRRGMAAGAFGLSAGPFYTPGNFSKTDEHVALARVAAEFDGFYTSHIRDEGDYAIGVVAAVDEVIQVAREARLPGIVTHIKTLGPRVWGMSREIIERINAARADGVEIYADQYPYEASATALTAALVPAWAQEGGTGALKARLANPEQLRRIRTEMEANLARRAGAQNIQIRTFKPDSSLEGLRLDVVARRKLLDPVEAAIEIIRAGGASIVSFNMDERDIRAFMIQPWTMTCSDGELVTMGEGVPHPRSYGSFPRKLRRYVVAEKVLSLEQAIYSMTGLPAAVFRVRDRGVIRAGAMADLVLFDLAAVRDLATYDRPHQLSQGMKQVFVNGRLAFVDEHLTTVRAGRVLLPQ